MREQPRVVAISGAGTGIGKAAALKLAALGWNVAVGGRRVDKLHETVDEITHAGGRAFSHPLDVADHQSVDGFFAAVEGEFGTVTAVVNNAGSGQYHSLADSPPEQIATEINIKLVGSLLMARRGIRGMQATELPGDILFVSSLAATQPWPLQLTYGAASAGIDQASRTLRMELEGTGIRVHLLHVGQTGGTDWGTVEMASGRLLAAHPEWFRRGLLGHTGLLFPDDVATAIVTQLSAKSGVQYDVVVRPVPPVGPLPQSVEEYFMAMAAAFADISH